VAVQRDFITSVFGGDEVTQTEDGRYNILLLGGDAGPERVGLRPDSITIASIDEDTGRTVLFGLPRNLADVPFPAGSPMHKAFPHGFNCEGCYLNGVNTWANDHADLYPGDKNPGITATTQAVEQITGLSINYYALIDLRGFQDLVDAVGGITITVPENLASPAVPAGTHTIDGETALRHARYRGGPDGDFGRIQRQQEIMRALIASAGGKDLLTEANRLLPPLQDHVRTDLSLEQLVSLAKYYQSNCSATGMTLDTIPGDVVYGPIIDPLFGLPLSYVVSDPKDVQTKVDQLMGDAPKQ
jgi:LCP family protein required for cell wall assembly